MQHLLEKDQAMAFRALPFIVTPFDKLQPTSSNYGCSKFRQLHLEQIWANSFIEVLFSTLQLFFKRRDGVSFSLLSISKESVQINYVP